MAYPQGRYAGRQDGNRPRHRGDQPQNSGNQHRSAPRIAVATPAPSADMAQAASVIQVRNFKKLIEVAGEENIALGLEISPQRVSELGRGERFTHETIWHIEQTLGLPGGFMDQVNPLLPEDTIARLKSPLEHKPAPEPEVPYVPPVVQVPVSQVSQSIAPLTAQSEHQEEEMAKAAAAKKTTPAKTPAKKAAAKTTTKKAARAAEQTSLPLQGDMTVPDVRAHNLRVLTSRSGSKSKLAELTGLTGSTISHRLHGAKLLDDAEAAEFSKVLHLPAGWLDIVQDESSIPAATAKLLQPAPRGQATQAAAAGKRKPPVKTAAKSGKTREKVMAPADLSVPKLSTGLGHNAAKAPPAPASATIAPAVKAARALRSAAAPAAPAAQLHEEPAAQTATLGAPAASAAPAPARSAAPIVTPEDLANIGPIAEALIKTLCIKARDGRILEPQALALLTEISAL